MTDKLTLKPEKISYLIGVMGFGMLLLGAGIYVQAIFFIGMKQWIIAGDYSDWPMALAAFAIITVLFLGPAGLFLRMLPIAQIKSRDNTILTYPFGIHQSTRGSKPRCIYSQTYAPGETMRIVWYPKFKIVVEGDLFYRKERNASA